MQVTSWASLRFMYNWWCYFVKGVFFPDIIKDENNAEKDTGAETPTASEVVDKVKNIKNVDDAKEAASAAKKVAEVKIKNVKALGAKKLGMSEKDMKALSNLKNMGDAKNMLKKTAMKKALSGKMKGGDKAIAAIAKIEQMNPTEAGKKGAKMAKELAIFLILPTFFLSVILVALACQIIPFMTLYSMFYDNNIFVGLFMLFVVGFIFMPFIGSLNYVTQLAYLIVHIFIMPTFKGTGIPEFKYYASKYKILWFCLWSLITLGIIKKEFESAGYPYNGIWKWTAGGFAISLAGYYWGVFNLFK